MVTDAAFLSRLIHKTLALRFGWPGCCHRRGSEGYAEQQRNQDEVGACTVMPHFAALWTPLTEANWIQRRLLVIPWTSIGASLSAFAQDKEDVGSLCSLTGTVGAAGTD